MHPVGLAGRYLVLSLLVVAGATPATRGDEPRAGDWQVLLPEEGLGNWARIDFADGGGVRVREGVLSLETGKPFTGVVWTGAVTRCDYEIELEARRDQGEDFFCGLTVPVEKAYCSLIVGGWGGGVVGISSIDGVDASENETTQYRVFESSRWYRIRLRVTAERLSMWIDDEQMFDVDIRDRRISLRHGDIDRCVPLGLAAWRTGASIRNIRLRRVEPSGEATAIE